VTQGRGTLFVALAACSFATISIFTVLATRAGIALPAVLAWRYLIAVFLLATVAGGPRALSIPPRRAAAIIIIGGLLQSATAGLGLSSLRYIPAATFDFLFYTFPAWVALISVVRRLEPLDGVKLGALALSLTGVAVMVGSPWSATSHPTGVALALASGVAYALLVPIMARLQRDISPTVGACYMTLGGGLFFFLFDLATDVPLGGFPLHGWMAIVAMAAIPTTLGYALFFHGLASLAPVRASIVSTIEPFVTAVLGALFLAQPVTVGTMIGGVLIAAAVVVLQWRHVSRTRREVPGSG
jgi:drug/metabolite transporter (DMT)-like permease